MKHIEDECRVKKEIRRFVYLLLSLLLLAGAMLGFSGPASAAGTPGTLSAMNEGDMVNFAGYTWIVLNPSTGYLLMLGTIGEQPFGQYEYSSFDPNISGNIADYLNNSFYKSLNSEDQALIQTDSTWTTGPEGSESSTPTVTCAIGLLSYDEFTNYSEIIDYNHGDYRNWNPIVWGLWWLRTPSPFFLTDGSICIVEGMSSGGIWTWMSKAYVRPALYLSSETPVTGGDGGTVSQDLDDITAFSVAGQVGASIDTVNHAVTFTMPLGAGVSNLSPVITTDGVSVSPLSGTAKDFSSPVTYTVTAQSGLKPTWTVACVPGPAFQDAATDRGGSTVEVAFSKQMNATPPAAPAGFTVTVDGSVYNVTGVALDSNTSEYDLTLATPVVYGQNVTVAYGSGGVTSADGGFLAAFDPQTVTDNVPVGDNDITGFSVTGQVGSSTIDPINGTVTFHMPFWIGASGLSPVITTDGVSVSPASGTAEDFSSPVTYTVTDSRTLSMDWTVNCIVDPPITSFSFGGLSPPAPGRINGTNITLAVPYGTDVTGLVATFTTSPGSIVTVEGTTQVSGTTPNDFFSSVTYTVTGADGRTTATFTVTVTAAPQSVIGWWKLDDGSGTTAYDSSGYGNGGTLTSSSAWSANHPPSSPAAGSLDFSSGCGFAAPNPAINVTGYPSPYPTTISAWVYWYGGGSAPQIIAYQGNPGSDGYGLILSGGYLQILCGGVGVITGPPLPANGWHHVSITKNKGYWSLYLDGVSQVSNVYKIPFQFETGDQMCIGSFNSTDSFNGLIDDVLVYNTPLPGDASLASVLGQTITPGSQAGTATDPKLAAINVASLLTTVQASDVAVTKIILDATTPSVVTFAAVTFYGTDSSFTTPDAGSVTLTAGEATNVYIKVAAQDGTTFYYRVTVVAAVALSTPTISGTAQVGSVLTAALSPADAAATYQWEESTTSGGSYTAISGATSDSYTIDAAYSGDYIEVVATVPTTDATYIAGSATSAATGQIAAAAAAVPETMSAVAATNGTVTITLAAAPTTAPVTGDFTATSTIGTGTAAALTLGDFSYDSATATVTYTFTPVAATASDQSVVVAVTGGTTAPTPMAATAFTVTAAAVPETMSAVAATNGTVTITLAAAPTTAPVTGDFTATSTIGTGTAAALTLGDFSYDSATATVTYTFTAVAQTASAQSVVVTVAGGTGSPMAATAFDVAAATTTGLTFNPVSGTSITTSTPIYITAYPALSTSEAVYWNTTGPLPATNDSLYQSAGFNLSVSGTVYAAVYDSQTGSWGDQASATYTVGPVTVPVNGVTLSANTLNLTVGGAVATLTATVTPSNATNKAVTWSSDTLSVATVTNGVVAPVAAGTATITVTTADGGKSATCAVTVSTPVTVTTTTPTVPVTTTPVQITVPSGVTDATLTTTPTQAVPGGNETVTLPQVTTTSTTSDGNVDVSIPDGTVVTGPSTWNGTINLPQVVSNTTVTVSGYTTTVSEAIELGFGDTELTFSQAVRIDLVGQTGKLAGWFRNGVFTPITTVLTGNSQAIGDALPAGGDGYFDNGTDLIIWTKHFTTFVAYTETAISSPGGGGGAAVVYTPAVQTEAATSVVSDSAVLNGDITSDNGYDVTDYGFLWGTSSSSLTNKLDVGTDNHSGAFTDTLSSLTAGTAYYFQGYATNSQGTADGAVMSFSTTGTTPTTPAAPTTPVFSDVSASYWGYDAISSLSSKGIVSGYPDGTFKPDASITRAEFATMLVKALGLDTTGTTGQFTDVTADSWYYGSVNAAASAGLVSGMGDNLFAPNALITREQMAVMVSKALGNKAPATNGTELNAFSDSSSVSSWAVSGMEEAVKAGIVSGMTADTLAPQADATRAQAAVMIYKLLTVLGK
jgi:hypothetical protein